MVAFARRHEGRTLVAIAGRLFLALTGAAGRPPLGFEVWGDTAVDLSPLGGARELANVLTGEALRIDGRQLALGRAFDQFPVALLYARCRAGPHDRAGEARRAVQTRSSIDRCRAESVRLLERNLAPDGILAATPTARSDARGYSAVFGRDAAVCALGMAVSGDPALERAAATGLATLAAHQAPNGQIPKFVDTAPRRGRLLVSRLHRRHALVAAGVALLDRLHPDGRLAERWPTHVARAIQWLACQEHQRFFLLQQNEASDWADIMPRSGFVLYTNALWHFVKRLYVAAARRRDSPQLEPALPPVLGAAWPSTAAPACSRTTPAAARATATST